MSQSRIVPAGETVVAQPRMTQYVLQFPGLSHTTVMVIDDLYREGFIDIYSPYIVSSSATIAPPQGIPDACLIACTPEQDDTCAICLEEAHDSEHGWISLSRCTHRFHRNCMTQVRGKSCPLCRTLQSA